MHGLARRRHLHSWVVANSDRSITRPTGTCAIRIAWTPAVAQTQPMLKLAALLLAITGVLVSVCGILLFWVLRRSGVWGDRDSREMWRGISGTGTTFDSSVFRTSRAKKAMSELWKENPRLAAEAEEHQRQFEELEASKPDAFKEVRKVSRVMSRALYVVPALVVFGAVAAAAGVLWFRSL